MKYKNLSNDDLVITLKTKSAEERKLDVETIELLEEMENRKLYLVLGFSSLIEFCIEELKYSETTARRKASAMRVAKEIPEIKVSIQEGSLNLGIIAQAQSLFKFETKNNKTHLSLTIDDELMADLEKIKSLISHQNLNPTMAELIKYMADLTLKKLDPQQPKFKREVVFQNKKSKDLQKTDLLSAAQCKAQPAPVAHPGKAKIQPNASRYIPTAIKRTVWQNANSKCEYTHINGKRCGSTFQLQIDHIKPLAKGGLTNPENLRLLCRNHNIQYACNHFGKQWMNRFVESPHEPYSISMYKI